MKTVLLLHSLTHSLRKALANTRNNAEIDGNNRKAKTLRAYRLGGWLTLLLLLRNPKDINQNTINML